MGRCEIDAEQEKNEAYLHTTYIIEQIQYVSSVRRKRGSSNTIQSLTSLTSAGTVFFKITLAGSMA